MRILLFILTATLFLSACGKKAPLRPPEDPQEEAARS